MKRHQIDTYSVTYVHVRYCILDPVHSVRLHVALAPGQVEKMQVCKTKNFLGPVVKRLKKKPLKYMQQINNRNKVVQKITNRVDATGVGFPFLSC
jgi:hypothetical protein